MLKKLLDDKLDKIEPIAVYEGPKHKSRVFRVGDQIVKLSEQRKDVFYLICKLLVKTERFPSPIEIAPLLWGKVTDRNRGHIIRIFQRIEKQGLISRGKKGKGLQWKKHGQVTLLGVKVLPLLKIPDLSRWGKNKRIGGGTAPNGGTRFPNTLVSVDKLGENGILQFPSKHSKLGARVEKSLSSGRQMDLQIADFSLEEGRTCDPNCTIKDLCYAGKMPDQRRILHEGIKTDRAIAKAICNVGTPLHIRINTIGDFPSQEFLEGIFAAVEITNSTAFGYTHWTPESDLGGEIRELSDMHWDFFSIRTSYGAEEEPLPERGAVIMKEFDTELLERHNAIPCPQQADFEDTNCGKCGLCWTTRRNIAFKIH